MLLEIAVYTHTYTPTHTHIYIYTHAIISCHAMVWCDVMWYTHTYSHICIYIYINIYMYDISPIFFTTRKKNIYIYIVCVCGWMMPHVLPCVYMHVTCLPWCPPCSRTFLQSQHVSLCDAPSQVSFWDKLSIIPIESPVIFLLGEIDCRDGILRSVQKACWWGKHAKDEH